MIQKLVLPVLLAIGSSHLFAADDLYVDPSSNAAIWVRQHPQDPRSITLAQEIASTPSARWITPTSGEKAAPVEAYVNAADSDNKVPILVIYGIPDRDCGGQSAGGVADEPAYRTWIDEISAAIGDHKAIVVLEPDALAQLHCLPTAESRQRRIDMLRYAVSSLKSTSSKIRVFLDAGHANWKPAAEMAERLIRAGIAGIDGFSLNVSNFYTTQQNVLYGDAVNKALSLSLGTRKAMLIDTSRNGLGSSGQWCNPPHSKIGERPNITSSTTLLAWIKLPGNSDGRCGAATSVPAGVFSPDLALQLIDGR